MPKVNINGHDHQVEIVADDDTLDDVVKAAQTLWEQTRGPEQSGRGPGSVLHQQNAAHPIGFARRMGDGQQPHVTARTENP